MHLPASALPGAAQFLIDPAGQAVAAQVFGPRAQSAQSAAYLGRAAVAGQLTVGQGAFTARAAEINGAGDTRLLVRDSVTGKAVNLSMSHGTAGAGNAALGVEGLGVAIIIDGATGLLAVAGQSATTGAATPTLSANKPGANSGVAAWLKLKVNGTDYYLPLWT